MFVFIGSLFYCLLVDCVVFTWVCGLSVNPVCYRWLSVLGIVISLLRQCCVEEFLGGSSFCGDVCAVNG